MNARGQAFSVFKILIAGIVALAILGILLPLLQGISTPQSDPQNIAAELVKGAYTQPGSVQTSSQKAIFDRDKEISAKAIQTKVPGLLPEQICLLPGKYETYFDNALVSSSGGSLLKYSSPSSQSFKVKVYCDTVTDIPPGLTDRGLADTVGTQFNSCNCKSGSGTVSATDICCVVYPER
ncbi:MAG: hypothetical protein HY917_01700 [Candidatus Diapherotrites archaeon]|nr:hypothetical protein [Candidatus Diapherotrites archaeon]